MRNSTGVHGAEPAAQHNLFALVIGSIGVVYGDIGTVRFAVTEAAAMPLPANRQFGRADIFQPEALDEFCGRGRKPGLIGRRAIVLLF